MSSGLWAKPVPQCAEPLCGDVAWSGGEAWSFGVLLAFLSQVQPAGRVGMWTDPRLCGQAGLGLRSGSVVHSVTRSK